MLINYLFIVLSGFLLSWSFVFLLKKLAFKYNVLNSNKMPRIGGFGMGLSFTTVCLVAFFIRGNLPKEIIGIIITSLTMLIFGAIDDHRELSIMTKFIIQIIIASLLVLSGVRTHIVYIGDTINILITLIWILGITNAFNHLDIMDGLAAGIAMLVSLAFFVVAFMNNDSSIIILSLAISGAIFGFLIYNFPPARVYMGNAGSHFLGFILSAIALVISYAPLERKAALLSPLLILGLPIFDTAFLILMRLKRSRSIFKKSDDHLVFRFLKIGYSQKKTLLFIYMLTLLFSLSGILVSKAMNLLGIAIVAVIGIFCLFLTIKMDGVAIDG